MELTKQNIIGILIFLFFLVMLYLTKRKSDKVLNQWMKEMEDDNKSE